MSLSLLKERLNQISKKNAEDTSTFQFDITNHKDWLKGNTPTDWLEYIQHIKDNVEFPNTLARHNSLSDVYEEAFKNLKSDDHKDDEDFAKLHVGYARLKSDTVPDDASMLFHHARYVVKKFAMVHIASAQFELERDNRDRAKKILEKALPCAQPVEDIKEALQKLKRGENDIYESPVRVRLNDSDTRRQKNPSGSDTSEEYSLKFSPSELLSSSMIGSRPSVLDKKPEPVARVLLSVSKPLGARPSEPATVSNLIEKLPTQPHGHLDSSHHVRGLKSFRSTPLLNSEKKSSNIGLPARVKRIKMPFKKMQEEDEEEEEMNTMDCFKPLDKDYGSSTQSSGFGGHHTSGYHSMISANTTIPLEEKQDQEEMPPPKPEPVEARKAPLNPASSNVTPTISAPLSEPVPCTPNNKVIPSTPMQSLPMLTVNDEQYAVLRVTGSGGSSKVYQVLDSSHKIKAIKVVNLDNTNDIIVEGYKNEIKLLKRLQYCDKVIKLYDSEFKEDENKLYVVMECGSEDLASFFRSKTKDRHQLSFNLIRFYWEFMLEAVQALHREGIIHSDLKPANFLLVGGNLKLIDFGIAKALQQDKTCVILDTQIGTLNYMSPEAIMDSCGDMPGSNKPKYKIGVKSDVWSLGCILYNMVYRRTPFQHLKHDLFKLQAIINPDFPIEFPDVGDPHLVDVMKQCLNRDPKQRPSIDQLLQHPYLNAEKETTKEESPVCGKTSLNKKMEALVNSLANQYALSPNGVRNLIEQTISSDQATPEALQPQDSMGPSHLKAPPLRPQSLVQRPEGPVKMKQIRTPLSCLDLQDLQNATPSSNNQGLTHRKPSS